MEDSENYTKDAYIFKGDFKSFFMSMSKSLLWEMIDLFIRDNYKGDDIECLLYILRTVIFHQPKVLLRQYGNFLKHFPVPENVLPK